jgi:hypothetical protein
MDPAAWPQLPPSLPPTTSPSSLSCPSGRGARSSLQAWRICGPLPLLRRFVFVWRRLPSHHARWDCNAQRVSSLAFLNSHRSMDSSPISHTGHDIGYSG